MPITSSWFNDEKSILYIKFEGKWTLSEYHENISHNAKITGEQPHATVSIVDLSESKGVPSQFLSSGRHSENIVNENNSGIVLFGLNMYMETIARVFSSVFPKSTKGMVIASSREEAIQTAQDMIEKLKQDQ